MKRMIFRCLSLILVAVLTLTGCSFPKGGMYESSMTEEESAVDKELEGETPDSYSDGSPEYHLDDAQDLEEYSQIVYESIIDGIDSPNILVEDVQISYYSDEYIQDVIYNSKDSIFFGYSLSELENRFKGNKYAFSVADDGSTCVHEFTEYDFTKETIIRNVAIGTGVIAVCVIVTIATYGAASEATVPCAVVVVNEVAGSMAKAAVTTAVVGAAIGGVTAGVITGLETNDLDAAIKAAALQASKDYMFGAITGAVIGGAAECASIASATAGGLSFEEAAFVQKSTKLSSKLIKQLNSIDEYYELAEIEKNGGLSIKNVLLLADETDYPIEVIKAFRQTQEGLIYSEQAGLYAREVNGTMALVRDINLDFESMYEGKMITNLQRMKKGLAPLDPATGEAYQLHHVGQKIDSPLAILTKAEHRGAENDAILHDSNIESGTGVHSLLTENEWKAQREAFWKSYAKIFEP